VVGLVPVTLPVAEELVWIEQSLCSPLVDRSALYELEFPPLGTVDSLQDVLMSKYEPLQSLLA
jgi:hypothetical protein